MVTVRPAAPDDLERLATAFGEFAAHYAEPSASEAERCAGIGAALFGPAPRAKLILAEEGGRVLGFLTWNSSFPAARLGYRVVIEDIFVLAEARGRGIGEALVRGAAEAGRAIGAAQLAWTTTRDNRGAQRFYERLGATRQDEKIVYRIATEELLKD